MEISELIVNGNHEEAVRLLNRNPAIYHEVRQSAGIGGIDQNNRTFTEVALEDASSILLEEMYLLPD
jgi:hypothetical protein